MRFSVRLALASLSALAVAAAATPALAAPPNAKWPGDSAVSNADGTNVFGTNLSGLSFQGADVLWAIKNGPGTLYRLVPNGSQWRPDTSNGWSKGKPLRYRDGGGDPDTEAVVATPDGIVAATERDNDGGESSLKVLRFDPASTARTLNATAEWDLTGDLPSVAANSGLEAISWVPDSALTAAGFRDERTGAAYNPGSYPGHGTGLYLVGLEGNGTVYAYALNQSGGSFTRVATFASGLPKIMDLEYEPGTGRLWASCDNNCNGRSATLTITGGKFSATNTYDRPSGMSNLNNEGFAISPACTSGKKQVVWADDGNTSSHALRRGTLSCTAAR